LGQTTLNHHTHATQRGRGHQDKSNDADNSWLLPPELAAHASRRRLGHWCMPRATTFSVFLFVQNQKCL
jgi:hypothetical protein